MHGIGLTRFNRRTIPDAAFVDSFGHQTEKSVSIAAENRHGSSYMELPEGQVYGKYKPDGLHYPLAKDAAQEAVADANVVNVADARQFFIGDQVEFPTAVSAGADRFREVTARDTTANTITLDGASFDLDAGDVIEVDPTRSFGEVKTTAAAPGVGGPTTIELLAGEAANFEVGDLVDVGADTDLAVTAVDTGADTIEVDADVAVADGEAVVSNPDGDYKLSPEVARLVESGGYAHPNPSVLTRRAGEVRERVLTGLTTRAKNALQPMIEFNPDI